jgi:hypothetical protein
MHWILQDLPVIIRQKESKEIKGGSSPKQI